MARAFLLVFLFIGAKVIAQQTAIYHDPEFAYRTGLDLLDKQKYGAAQKEFQKVIDSRDNISHTTRGNSAFYIAKCAAELFNKDAEYLLLAFIADYPANPNYGEAAFELGNYYYRLKRYKNAIEWMTKVDQSEISDARKDEINFKLGYSYYMTNEYEQAGKAFHAMKDGNSKYATAAQYYHAHIAYVNGNYETALNGFLKLKDSESFAPVVPYYITQIYYKQGKYDEVLKYSSEFPDTVSAKNGLEISRMVAESHYRKENYKEALPYLLDYEKNSSAAGRTDDYAIAFSYYRLGEYENAASWFQKVIPGDDSLSQNAYYHLADCFLHTKNRRSARNAFQSASKMNFDETIQEESHFNFARLSYELSFQSVALESFRSFMKNFPGSKYYKLAEEMLIDIYTSTKNYKDAIEALDAIKDKSLNLQTAYQKVAYYRGVELYMDNKHADAVKMFALSGKFPIEQKFVAEAYYWMGESQYRLKEYEDAIKSYSLFIVTPYALRLKHYNTANYNIGYAFFKKADYANAQMAFRKYILDKSQTDRARFNDALLRLGDCFFMLNNHSTALDYYNQAIASNAKAGDYALYQKAIIVGVQGKLGEKVVTLQKLMDNYPKSVYFDNALYEAGQASLAAQNYEKAATYYRKVINEYPSSAYVRKAELGEALVYYNTRQDEKAMSAFKKIVQKYPGTTESREALAQLKNISISQNKVDEYLTYVKGIPNADMSSSEQDSITYEAAELRYTERDCEGAVKAFTAYLEKFPNAIFRTSATYLRSDCLYRDRKFSEALAGYEYVIQQPVSNFTERALLHSALINYNWKEYAKALPYFDKLQEVTKSKDNTIAALAGRLRCTYRTNDCSRAIDIAGEIVKSTVADKDLVNEAHLTAGRCYIKNEDLTNAKSDLSIVAKRTNSEMTAESKYLLATIEYKMGNYKESQKLVFEIQKQNPSYDYWIAKGFILLGDNYLALKDTFQAKETYKSIIENFEQQPDYPDDLRDIARQKLSVIAIAEENRKATEKGLKQQAPADTLEFEPGN